MRSETSTLRIAQRIAFASLIVMICAVLGVKTVYAAIPSAVSDSGFCKAKVAHDYLAPLRRMIPLRHVPASGNLPFGPKGISIYMLGDGLRVGKGAIGFAFSDSAVNYRRRLNWVVRTELASVDSKGRPSAVIATKFRHIGVKKIAQVTGQRFVVPGQPAYYRVTIDIRKENGHLLGRYGEYYRVVAPRFGVRNVVNDEAVVPGETVFARIENTGTETVTADSQAEIERFTEGRWEEISPVTALGLKPALKSQVLGGEVGPCFAYKVPSDQGLGTYRFNGSVTGSMRNHRKKMVAAQFQVTVPSGE